jgi:alcohol dehydrogenase (cytochrome c)
VVLSFCGEKQRGPESQPLVSNGKIFVTASFSRMYAVDAKTGTELWQYDARLPDGILPCCDVVNRGPVLYGNLVIFATPDAQLGALDQDTGKVVWKQKLDDYKAGYSFTSAPLIAKNTVVTDVSGGEFGIVGRMDARNAQTGELTWMRPTVEGHMGYNSGKENGLTGKLNNSWPGDLWKTGGAATGRAASTIRTPIRSCGARTIQRRGWCPSISLRARRRSRPRDTPIATASSTCSIAPTASC